MSPKSTSKKGPGRHPKGEEPLVVLVDSDWKLNPAGDWTKDIWIDTGSTTFHADLNAALERKQLSGIVVQLDPTNQPCCHGLRIAEWIRMDRRGTPPIIFVSRRQGAACGGNNSSCTYPQLHQLIENRGSRYLAWGRQTGRKDVVEALQGMRPLSEAARLNIELNYLDLHGRLLHLLEHELVNDGRANAAEGDLRRLAEAFLVQDKMEGLLKQVAEIRKEKATESSRSASIALLRPNLLALFPATPDREWDVDTRPLEGCEVLVIEDDDDFAQRLDDRLYREGCSSIQRVKDGIEAAVILSEKKHTAHALIADWELLDNAGKPQVAWQGFELLSKGGREITVRIALTSMSSRTRSAIGSSLMRIGVPNLRMYRKADLDTPAVWDGFVRDIADSAQWSQRIIQDRVKEIGLGKGDWELWQQYFMTLETEEGAKTEKSVSAEAVQWWSELLYALDETKNDSKEAQSLKIAGTLTFQSKQGGSSDTVHKLLLVRRITLAVIAWMNARYGHPNLSWNLDGFLKGPFAAGDPKNFRNRFSIAVEALKKGNGVLPEEKRWLDAHYPGWTFGGDDTGKLQPHSLG